MHIGFIEDTPLRGGTQIWVMEATKVFLDKGEDVTVLAPTDTFVANECRNLGARVLTYDWEGVESKGEEYKKTWIEALAPCDVAVCTVHPPRNGFHCSVFGAECIKAGGLNTILVPKTGTIVPEYLREFYVPDEAVRTKVVSITNFTREYLVDSYKIPADMVDLVYQGTEVDRFTSTPETKQEALNRYPLPDNAGPILASVGSFEERKGQVVLLEAVAKLAAGPLQNVHVMFVGEGPDEEMLKAKVKEMKLENNATFFPFTKEPNYVFERINILTLPSLYKEGLPNVLLEAMSMGLPVISSKMAGIPEIVFDDKTGYMVEPGNVDQLAKAVEKMWSNQEACQEMGKNARKLMEDKFDKKHQFGAFLDYFHKISGK